MRPPYKPGDHAHASALLPGYGTCLVPVTIVACTRNFDGGPGRWTVTWTHPDMEGARHGNANDYGEGDYILPPAEMEKCRRSRNDDTPACPGCVAAGAVDPDGPVYSLTEQVMAAAGVL